MDFIANFFFDLVIQLFPHRILKISAIIIIFFYFTQLEEIHFEKSEQFPKISGKCKKKYRRMISVNFKEWNAGKIRFGGGRKISRSKSNFKGGE